MSDVARPDPIANPLVAKLADVGPKAFCKMVADGEIPSLTDKIIYDHQFERIIKLTNEIREDELVEVNVPKRDEKGGYIMRDGYVESEKRMVFKRQHTIKLELQKINKTEKQFQSWLAGKNKAKGDS